LLFEQQGMSRKLKLIQNRDNHNAEENAIAGPSSAIAQIADDKLVAGMQKKATFFR
jgi:hypothetical protein